MLHYIITQSEATNRSRKKDNEKKYVICQPNHPTQTHQKVLELCQGQLAPSPLVMCLLYLETEDRPCFKSYTHKIHTSQERENSLLNVNLTSQQHCVQQSQCTEAKKVKVSICHHHQCIFLRITHHSHTAWLLCPATFCHLTERREKKCLKDSTLRFRSLQKKTHQFELL